MSEKKTKTTRATVLLLEDGIPSTAIVAVEILGSVGVTPGLFNGGKRIEPYFQVNTAALSGDPLSTPYSLTLTAEKCLDEISETELVVIPAIGIDIDQAVEKNRRSLSWISEQYKRGAEIAAVCTGVGLLAATGLLDGKLATTHREVVDDYRKRFPKVRFQPENLITEVDGLYCGGAYSALDLSVYLVERYCGHEVALQTARNLAIPPPLLDLSSHAIRERPSNHGDERIREVAEWMQDHYTEPFHLKSISTRFAMSPRSLDRRFRDAIGSTPLHYMHLLRINAAKRLLETSMRSVNEICYAVGYEDVAFFRKLFSRHTALNPSAYRKRYELPAERRRQLGYAGNHRLQER